MLGIHRNGVTVAVVQLQNHKHESLCVMFDNEPHRMYVVASFVGIEASAWFKEVLEQLFEGMKIEER